MTAAAVVLNVAYAALMASTFTRTLTWLRVALIAGATLFVVYGVIERITSMIIWNSVIGGMHLVRLLRDLAAHRSVELSVEESRTRDELLPELDDFDFNLLWKVGVDRDYVDAAVIATGEMPTTVALVIEGQVEVHRGGELIRWLRRGALIGEMSFVSGQHADADVIARGPVRVHEWQQRDLVCLDQVNPASAKAFRNLVSRDLAAKARL